VAWAGEAASPTGGADYAPLAQAVSGRQYYLTAAGTYYDGSQATTACAEGYHMASMWELLDVSNLIYNTTLGFQHSSGDQGDGPPAHADGWVRSGLCQLQRLHQWRGGAPGHRGLATPRLGVSRKHHRSLACRR
jgi:hypothetical protein